LTGEFGSFTGKDILPSLLKMPDVIQKEEEKTNENEWSEIQKGIDSAGTCRTTTLTTETWNALTTQH
jgi:hypothetical protein